VQYPGLQVGGALGNASTPGTPDGCMAASTHGGTNSHVAGAGAAWGGETGAAAATAAAAAGRRGAAPTGGAVTPPRSAPAHGGRGGRHGARAGGRDRPPRDGVPLTALLDGVCSISLPAIGKLPPVAPLRPKLTFCANWPVARPLGGYFRTVHFLLCVCLPVLSVCRHSLQSLVIGRSIDQCPRFY